MKTMKKADMKVYRERLIQLRARLRGDVSAMASTALDGNNENTMPIHMADVGSDNFEQEFTLSLMENDGETIEMIEGALERIEAATYGRCVECEGVIPKTRLNAIPYTPFCVKCASQIQSR
jgi:DnaK suppressor protein